MRTRLFGPDAPRRRTVDAVTEEPETQEQTEAREQAEHRARVLAAAERVARISAGLNRRLASQ